ncbi:hypothetical protein [Luteolibacter sp. LG18]|uniref:hypothetical protein n=1 Tax=Luteolibacter sp. LG18 TaxID=2819286 RepID=UPI002B30616F|nr:hypothetical protein llg_11860 [Luteolibacter sp. LG18]
MSQRNALTEIARSAVAAIWRALTAANSEPEEKFPTAAELDAALGHLQTEKPELALLQSLDLLATDQRGICPPLGTVAMELAMKLPIRMWPRVDEAIRRNMLSSRRPLAPLPTLHGPAVEILALCHHSGQVRAEAIRHRGQLPALLRASLLFVRLNDWAPPVRDLAEKHLPQVVGELDQNERMRLVPLVERLRDCGRSGFRERRDALEAWRMALVGERDEDAWLWCWNHAQGKERGLYLGILKSEAGVPGPRTRRALLESNDRTALLWYIRSVLPRLGDEDREAATLRLDHARVVPVRREWLTFLVETEPQAVVPKLVTTLLVPSKSLRQFARFHLARLAPMDFAAHYRAALNTAAYAPVALQGLCETCPAEGRAMAARHLDSDDAALKKAALLCLPADSIAEHVDRFLQDADDPRPGIGKVARRRLGDAGQALGVHLLSGTADWNRFSIELRTVLMKLCIAFNKWDGLELLLSHAREHDPAFVLTLVRQWRQRENRAFLRLPPERKERLKKLARTAPLPDHEKEELAFILEKAMA